MTTKTRGFPEIPYTASRLRTVRRPTHCVMVGDVGIGGDNPIRVQSMTTTLTQDIEATVRQSIALYEAGCEIVRITAPNVKAARCLGEIRDQLRASKIPVPLVADIHFLPSAAMEAVEHVEKVRVNPGNYADKKKFQVLEYDDAAYEREIQRLYEAFSPLVQRCKALGRAMRIGTNHGSLSDRIMNRYGDTPLGMVESALEFVRIAESHGYRDIVLSFKSSNPKVMIQAYRLACAMMAEEGMGYPLHLGVTEAGDGEDGRSKSAVGIGSLLLDGLGDTIRVSLTEDPVYEIPVARALADKAMSRWEAPGVSDPVEETVQPYAYQLRKTAETELSPGLSAGALNPPRVILSLPAAPDPDEANHLGEAMKGDTPVEGFVMAGPLAGKDDFDKLCDHPFLGRGVSVFATPGPSLLEDHSGNPESIALPEGVIPIFCYWELGLPLLRQCLKVYGRNSRRCVVNLPASAVADLALELGVFAPGALIISQDRPEDGIHPVGSHRRLVQAMEDAGLSCPLWIRYTVANRLETQPGFLNDLLEASLLTGALIADGFGDLVSVECIADRKKALALAYQVLQSSGSRFTRTEFVACPSCGRTLFDLQETTRRIRSKTGHLKGVRIAIMGCIVNGPGEMADADFGYVGGAPGKVNLYVGKECVQYHVPQEEADQRLIDLIREHGKWVEPPLSVPN